MKNLPKITIKELEGSEIEITGQIEFSVLEAYRSRALQNLNKEVSLPGFRKGNIPEKVLVSKVGEMPVLEEMAEIAIAKIYPEIILSEKIEALGRPTVTITTLSKDNPMAFKIVTAVTPKFKLPDYKKIAGEEMKKGEEAITVSDEEVEKVLTDARKSKVDHSNHSHDTTEKEHDELIEKMMPELNDEFAQSLGDFKDLEDLRVKVREGIMKEKEHKAKEKKRVLIAEKIINETKITLPKIIIESELNKLEGQFKDDIQRMGIKLQDYLSHIKKTIEDLRKEWVSDAEKKAKFQMILNEIAKAEKIAPDQDEIDKEVKHILDHYKDADKESAEIYVKSLLTNEKIFAMFEAQ
jgi:FKBP-type peptidyl-prolyl cis-trans isomerase (trigger factor)